MRLSSRISIAAVLAAVLGGFCSVSRAALVIDVGNHDVPVGSSGFSIPITVSGGDSVTDMAAYVQIGDGGPAVGGTAGPRITSVGYAGSVWTSAPGGFTPFISTPLPGQIIDPSVSLNTAGQSVGGAGTLMTLVLDVSGFSEGRTFDLKLAGTAGGDTAFARSGTAAPVTIHNGSIRLVAIPEPSSALAGAATLLAFGRWQRKQAP
jgi:hypothetical protein